MRLSTRWRKSCNFPATDPSSPYHLCMIRLFSFLPYIDIVRVPPSDLLSLDCRFFLLKNKTHGFELELYNACYNGGQKNSHFSIVNSQFYELRALSASNRSPSVSFSSTFSRSATFGTFVQGKAAYMDPSCRRSFDTQFVKVQSIVPRRASAMGIRRTPGFLSICNSLQALYTSRCSGAIYSGRVFEKIYSPFVRVDAGCPCLPRVLIAALLM